MIQSVTLILLIYTTQDYSSLLITIFSMIFTMMSISMSCFEFFLSSKFVKLGSNIIISFCIESKDISNMPHKQFQSEIVFSRIKFIGKVATLLKVKHEQVERLKPTRYSDGAMFVFTVAIGDDKYEEIKQRFERLIQDDIFLKVYTRACLNIHFDINIHVLCAVCDFSFRDWKKHIK